MLKKAYNLSLHKIFQNAEYYRDENDVKQLEIVRQADDSATKSSLVDPEKDLKSKFKECQEVILAMRSAVFLAHSNSYLSPNMILKFST